MFPESQNWADWIVNHAPFIAMTTGSPKFSFARIFEAVIISCITSAATFWLMVWQALPVIEVKLIAIERRLDKMEERDYEQDLRIFRHEGQLNESKVN